MTDVFDQMAANEKAKQNPQPQASQSSATPQAPAAPAASAAPAAPQSGDVFDQMAQQEKQNNPTPTSTLPASTSPYTWYERAEGAMLKHVLPEDNKVLSWVNEHVAQPHAKMGEAGGSVVEHWINGAIGQELLDAQDEKKRNGVSSVPAYAKGLEKEYASNLYESAMPVTSGISGGLANLGGQILSDPTNWPFLVKGISQSIMGVTSATLIPWTERLMAKGFGIQMAAGSVNQLKDLQSNWDTMSAHDKSKAITQLLAGTYFAQKSLREGFAADPKAEGPQPKPAAPRIAGEKPTATRIAGVDIPVSQQHAESIAGEKNMPVEGTTRSVHDINEFKRNETIPAATAAAHSVLGLGAEDLINQHDAILNNQAPPDPVSGENNPSKYQTIDDAAKALIEKARSTTYAKADEISEREQQEHARKVQEAVANEKAGIDHYNEMADEHNSQLGEDGEPIAQLSFDPAKISASMEADRPKTYGELKGAVDRAYADLKSSDAQVREEAADAVEKAEKQLEGWFKQHSDEISPEEYTSAKKLVYAGSRYQEVSNALRASIENDNLTGNKLRSVIASIDNRMIRRGEAPGAFRRLVGEDVYQNWRDISRLFDPIKGAPAGAMTYGKMALSFITHHFFGPLGLVGKLGSHWFMDKVLSSPEWGNWFKDMSEAVKNKAAQGSEIPTTLLQEFKALWTSTHGEMEIPGTGTMGNIGREAGAAAPAPALSPINEEPRQDMSPTRRENDDMEFNHPNGTSQMVLHPEPDPRPGFEGKTQLRQTGISAVDAPGAGQEMMDNAVARIKGNDSYSRIISDHPDRRSPDNEGHWHKLARRGHNVQVEDSSDSFAQPWEDWMEPAAKTPLNKGKSGKAYFIDNHAPESSQIRAHEANGGSTFDAKGKDLAGSDKYAVGAFPERTQQVTGELTPAHLRKFKTLNADLLNKEGYGIGTWLDKDTGNSVLDVTRLYDSKKAAIAAGKAANQKAIYHLGGEGEIPTGGTGEAKVTPESLKAKYGTTSDVLKAGFILPEGDLIPLTGEHDHMLGGKTTNDTREAFIRDTGTIRTRYRMTRAGEEQVFSLPSEITEDQAKQIRAAAGKLRNGRIVLETVDGKSHQSLDFPTGTKAQSLLESLVKIKPEEGEAPETSDASASEIATRRPTSTKVTPTNAAGQYADMAGVREASRQAPSGNGKLGYAEKLARTVSKYSGLDFTDEELKNPEAVMEKFVNHLTDNLVSLHDAMPEPFRRITRQWYNTANKLAKTMAVKHGVTPDQSAGVLASLSPQNGWDNNVALADRVIDTYKNRQNFEYSPKMEAQIAKIKQGQLSRSALGILKDIHGKTLAEIANDRMPPKFQKLWGDEAEGKWKNVIAAKQGMWVRLYDEAHNSPQNPMFHPNGDIVGMSPSNRSWIGLDHVAKAIRIINDGSVESINNVMGDGNKIRNFYNNIINPDSPNGHTTIDTHAVGAAHFQPFSGDNPEVLHNFGNTPKNIAGAPKHAATGMRGTYPLYAEAYQRAAKRLGVQPRELQSMTWEGIRSLMGDDKKTPELKSFARETWEKVQNKELTPQQARDLIIEKAGGFSKPAWMTEEQWDEAMGTNFNPEEFSHE